LDDEHAEWLQIGLQLRKRDVAAARHVLEGLVRQGFRDILGDVGGVLDGVWAMPERSFRDLSTWRVALSRVKALVK